MTSPLNGKTGEVLRWVAMLVLAGLVSYFTTTGALATRMAVAESRIDRLSEDIREIKSDVKAVLRAVR